MTFELAMRLRNALHEACPYDTGQLQLSIQPAPSGNTLRWVIVIGNNDGSMNGTPSNQYAAFTNNATTLKCGKENPNYHWANDAIKKWANDNGMNIAFGNEDEEDE